MVPEDAKKNSTQSAPTFSSLEEAAAQFATQLSGLCGIKVSANQLQEATSSCFKNVMNYCSLIGVNGCVTLIRSQKRRKLLLHKNMYLITIMLSEIPTTNNTHIPPDKPVPS